jgi:MFS family permease
MTTLLTPPSAKKFLAMDTDSTRFVEASANSFDLGAAAAPSAGESGVSEDAPETKRNLTASLVDGGGYSIMVGVGETYFSPFALAMGMTAAGAGLIVTVPVLIGSTLQLATPWAVQRLGSHRVWLVITVFLQVLCLLALPLAACFSNTFGVSLVAVAITLYWASGLSGGPPWNTWIEDIVPTSIRTHFFAQRQRLSLICLLASFVLGGLCLQAGQLGGYPLTVFTALFLMAALARLISGIALGLQTEPSRGKYHEQMVGLGELFKSNPGGGSRGGWLVIYLLAMQVGVQCSGPYFAPFMLKEEQFSYQTFMLLFAMGFLGKAIFMPYWGKVGQKYGPRTLLAIGGMLIIPLSSLWILSDYVPDVPLYLPATPFSAAAHWHLPGQALAIGSIQILSGCAWSAYELAMSLMFLHGIPREHRTSLLTWYNFGNSLAMVAGSMLGALLFRCFGESHSTYMMIFWVSSVMRLLTLPLLLKVR